MKLIFRQSVRNALKSKLIGVIVIVSMTISMIILYLNISVTQTIIDNYEILLRSVYGNADISVLSEKIFDYDDVQLSELHEEQVIKFYKVRCRLDMSSSDVNVRFAELDKCQTHRIINVKSGEIEGGEKNRAVISEKLSLDYGVAIGDQVSISYNGKECVFNVAAIASANGIYSLEEESQSIFIDYRYLNEFLEEKSDAAIVSSLFICLNDSESVDSVCETLEKNNEQLIIKKNFDNHTLRESVKSFNHVMLFVFILSVLLNFFILYSTLKLIILKRLPIIAIYRSLGATKNFAFKLICTENLIYTFLAGSLEIFLAPVMRKWMIDNYFGITNTNIAGISFFRNMFYVCICVGFAVLVLVLVTVIASGKVRQASIKNALFDKADTQMEISGKSFVAGVLLVIGGFILLKINNNYNIKESILGIILFFSGAVILSSPLYVTVIRRLKKICDTFAGTYVRLAFSSISRNKNIAGIIQMTTVTMSFVFTILILLSSVSKMFNNVSIGKADYCFSNLGEDYHTVLQEVHKYVDESYLDYYCEVDMDQYGKIILLGDNRDECHWKENITVTLRMLKHDEIILDKYFADKNKIATGDCVVLENSNGLIGKYEVVGFLDSYRWNTFRNVALINMDEYVSEITCIPTNVFVVAETEVKDELEEIAYISNTALEDVEKNLEYQRLNVNQFMKSIMALLSVSVCLGVVGISNHQIIAILNRRKEIAAKYVVAMSRREVIKSFIIEMFIMSGIISILSFMLGTGLLFFSENVLYSAGIPMVVCVDVRAVVGFVVSLLFIFGINIMIPIAVMSRMDIVQEIRTE